MLKLIVAASLSSFFFNLFGVDWDSVDQRIEKEYPRVEFISTEQLYRAQDQSQEVLPVVFDVRESEEFEISHLESAINLKTGPEIAALITDKNAPIVVYCSIGYRSAGVASELEELGYTNVQNLRHSIFEWADKDYPLISEQGDTDMVHPFNRVWGALLDKSLHQYSLRP